jgi:glycosyltransferase involved in cell wall biosynthesis
VSGACSFSIVIPTHERRDLVCDAIRALAASTGAGPIEVIVVVDGSTDGTAATLAALTTPFPLRVIEQENSGAAAARNRGAALATGDVLLFLDDDMMAAPDLLAQHRISHSEGADAVVGHIPLDPASPRSFLAEGVGRWAESRKDRLKTGAELTLFDLLTGQLSVKRSLFESLGGFDETFTRGGRFGDEDLDFGIRLLEKGKIVFNPHAKSYQRYVVTPRQLLRQWADAGRADAILAAKHPRHAAELYALHGADRPFHRLVLRPLAAIPGIAPAAAVAAIWMANRHGSVLSPLRPAVSRLFRVTRDLVYWAAVRQGVRALG